MTAPRAAAMLKLASSTISLRDLEQASELSGDTWCRLGPVYVDGRAAAHLQPSSHHRLGPAVGQVTWPDPVRERVERAGERGAAEQAVHDVELDVGRRDDAVEVPGGQWWHGWPSLEAMRTRGIRVR